MTDGVYDPKFVPAPGITGLPATNRRPPSRQTGAPGAARAGAKRPYVPPVIETLPPREGLAPDVILEWSGKSPCHSVTDLRGTEKDRTQAPQSARRTVPYGRGSNE